MTRRVVAVVPAFDEEAAIGAVVAGIREFDPEIEVVVVDDGSADGTSDAATAAGAIVVRLPFNLGIGAAVQTGFRYALEQDYDVAVRLDGDGQHDPTELPKLLEPLERGEADVVTGSRFRDDAGGYRAAARAQARDHVVREARLASLAAAGDRHDVRLPGPQPRGDLAVRPRLPERLPRGRGDGAPAQAPAAPPRGAGRDAGAGDRLVLDHVPALPLLRGQGDARAVRRHRPPLAVPTEGSPR